MKNILSEIPVSVLDLATIAEGDSVSDAFGKSLQMARHAEALGFTRYWFAEHHNMESVASAATAVLIGFIAGGTSTIRVGSGGVMLPNHAPLVIAEQFGTLASLYPGRIDLGIGRAPGTDGITAMALRRNLNSPIDQFPNDVMEVMGYLGTAEPGAKVKAIPGQDTHVPVWLLGSSTYSAQLAAMLGLPFAFAAHFAPTYLQEALQVYHERFQPSQYLKEPYSMACVNVIAADTDAAAQRLATSFYLLALGLIRNKRRPLQPPVADMDALWSLQEQAAVQQMMRYSFIGDVVGIEQELSAFVQSTGVNEIIVAAHIFDVDAKKRSYELVAPLFATKERQQRPNSFSVVPA